MTGHSRAAPIAARRPPRDGGRRGGGRRPRAGRRDRRHATPGRPSRSIVPRLGAPGGGLGAATSATSASRLAGGSPSGRRRSRAEVPIVSGGQELGAVLLLGPGKPRRRRVPARRGDRGPHRGGRGRGARRDRADPARLVPRGAPHARRPGGGRRRPARAAGWAATCRRGCVALVRRSGRARPGPADRGHRRRSARPRWRRRSNGRVYALVPGTRRGRAPGGDAGWAAAPRSASPRATPTPPDCRRALEEAELVLGVRAAGGARRRRDRRRAPTACSSACSPPTPRRSAASTRTRSRRSCATTSSTPPTWSGTLSNYLGNDCNMNSTASAIHAHRHTVGYRLERVKDLTGPRPAQQRGPRAPGPGPQGLPDHRAVAAALAGAAAALVGRLASSLCWRSSSRRGAGARSSSSESRVPRPHLPARA